MPEIAKSSSAVTINELAKDEKSASNRRTCKSRTAPAPEVTAEGDSSDRRTEEGVPLRLTGEQKLHIVTALACFVSPSDVAREVREIWGIEVSRQRLQCYDPTTCAGLTLRDELREHFYQTRREYVGRAEEIGVANQTMRLLRLDQIFNRHFEAGNLKEAAKILKQVAMDVGGKYSRHPVSPARSAPDNGLSARENLAAVLGVPVESLPKSRHESK